MIRLQGRLVGQLGHGACLWGRGKGLEGPGSFTLQRKGEGLCLLSLNTSVEKWRRGRGAGASGPC